VEKKGKKEDKGKHITFPIPGKGKEAKSSSLKEKRELL